MQYKLLNSKNVSYRTEKIFFCVLVVFFLLSTLSLIVPAASASSAAENKFDDIASFEKEPGESDAQAIVRMFQHNDSSMLDDVLWEMLRTKDDYKRILDDKNSDEAAVAAIAGSSTVDEIKYAALKYVLEDEAGALAGVVFEARLASIGLNPEISPINWALKALNVQQYKVDDGHGNSVLILHAFDVTYKKVIMPVGICLLMMYFLMETLNDVQLDSFNTEHFIKKLITLALAIIVVISGDKIFDYIASFGDALANEIRASLGSRYNYGLIKNTWLEICGAGSGFLGALVRFLQYIAILVSCLVSFLVNLIAGIVIAFISYARIIEITVRYLFAPIGCASLVSGGSQGGLHSPGMRYIKKFAAVCIQGAVIVAAAYAENYMQACSSATVGVIGGILMPLSLIGVAIKTKGIAEEIVGV